MTAFLHDVWLFTVAVITHWQALVTSSLLTALVFLIEHFRDRQLPKRTTLVVFGSVYLAIAAFLAWRDERVLRPGPDVEYYDSVIRADQDWRLVVNDRANPGTRVAVQIASGSLRVTLENKRGRSRTGLERTVRVEAPIGDPP